MIEINNLTNFRVNKKKLKSITQTILRGEKFKRKINLSIAFVGPGRIRQINKKYRKRNRITDVLAFPSFAEGYRGQARFLQRDSELGEIIICPSEVKKNAKRFSLTFKQELKRVLIHGLLHLLGYDHEKSESEARGIEEKENYYLSLIKS